MNRLFFSFLEGGVGVGPCFSLHFETPAKARRYIYAYGIRGFDFLYRGVATVGRALGPTVSLGGVR